jgi:hypothetical protein
MTDNGRLPEVDLVLYEENRNKFPPEQLLPYAGRYIAWSGDGTRVVASAETEEELYSIVDAAGIRDSQVVYDYVEAY